MYELPSQAIHSSPLRCFKCQRYGHIAAACIGRQRCPKCVCVWGVRTPRYEECKNDQNNCCNCGGQHRMTYGGCEVRKKEVEVEQVKVNNISRHSEKMRKTKEIKKFWQICICNKLFGSSEAQNRENQNNCGRSRGFLA